MAYRRRHSAKSSSTFVEDAPSSPYHDDGSSLAARAIRASSLHRDSSFSAAYGETVIPSPHRDSTNQETPPLYEQQEQQQQQASTTYEYTSMKNLNDSKSGFWGVLARKAKNIFEEEDGTRKAEMFGRGGPQKFGRDSPQTFVASAGVQHTYQSTETSRRTENPAIQKGLGAIASSLNYIGGKLENALEEGLTIVESKAADIISDTRKLNIRRKASTSGTPGQTQQPIYPEAKNLHMPAIYTPSTQTDYETQLKASRDVAMAMAAKAKLLLRELKTVKADLAFAKQRCTQLEEENRILRESNERGDSPEDDDLIRLQLETLLAEKARLAHENSIYARENRFLREIVEYHQLTMQDVVYLDEGIEEVKEVYPITIPFETQHAQVPSSALHMSPAPPGSASSTPPTPSLPPEASSPPTPIA